MTRGQGGLPPCEPDVTDLGEVAGDPGNPMRIVLPSDEPGGGEPGGGGGETVPQNPERLPFNNCAEFVDYLVKLSIGPGQRAAYSPSLSAVNAITRALGSKMMHTARFKYDSFGNNGYGGFKDELTAGEQNQGVYMHVLGNAGAALTANFIGDTIVVGNHIKDIWQTYRGTPRQRQEGPAELAGNGAGVRVGQHMWNYITGATPQEEHRLRNSLTSELCK